ncbi:sulfur carrier protein ThiS [Alteromonas sp. BMJM2]|uniref:sulfur carrier protein ThiS n=1 Tax=Alteromonas sp. BMJM2 TaxID=2954241 RepID=UPI0022B4C02D|nr:sulfur carrier protein ThiS [Alteromonas sp. BMJM2]
MNSMCNKDNQTNTIVTHDVKRDNKNDYGRTGEINSDKKGENTTITIIVNGEGKTCSSPISIDELAHSYATHMEGTAIAYNRSILSKSQWPLTHLQDGDHIDIFTLVAGG